MSGPAPPPALSEHERGILREHGRTWEPLDRDGRTLIRCLVCRRTTGHPDDIRHLYCSACHAFHEERELRHTLETEDPPPAADNAPPAADNALETPL